MFSFPNAGTYKLFISLSTSNSSNISRFFQYNIASQTNVDSATQSESHGQPGTSSDQLVYGSCVYEVVSSDAGDIAIEAEMVSSGSGAASLSGKVCANATILSII